MGAGPGPGGIGPGPKRNELIQMQARLFIYSTESVASVLCPILIEFETPYRRMQEMTQCTVWRRCIHGAAPPGAGAADCNVGGCKAPGKLRTHSQQRHLMEEGEKVV